MRAARSFLVLGALSLLGACSGSDGGELTFDSAAAQTSPTVVDTSEPTAPTSPPTVAPPTVPPASTATSTTASTAPPQAPAAARAYAVAPPGVPFPTTEWPLAALPAGVDGGSIDAAVDLAFGAPDAAGRVQSIVVVKDGAIVYERYHPLDGPDKVYDSWSVAKSFTSALIGLLVQDGLLELDEHPARAEWAAPGDPRQAITVRHLLQMTSGLAWIDDGFQPGTYGARLLSAQNAAHLVADQPLWAEPGTVFNYSTGTSALLVGIAADVLGGCQAVTDYLNARLLDPIGITTEQLVTDGDGCWIGGLGANMTTRDFARFGLLFLRGGAWDGTALLPSTWVDESRSPVPINPEYGLHWWLSADGTRFMAEGLYGQRIVLLPEQDLMVVTNSTEGGDPVMLVDSVVSAFGDAP